jgi:formate-dependent nitrite reductase cytochrome c552 subunit
MEIASPTGSMLAPKGHSTIVQAAVEQAKSGATKRTRMPAGHGKPVQVLSENMGDNAVLESVLKF